MVGAAGIVLRAILVCIVVLGFLAEAGGSTPAAGRTAAPMEVDGRTGRLFLATQRGVQVRSTQNGTLLRTVSLGQAPAAIYTAVGTGGSTPERGAISVVQLAGTDLRLLRTTLLKPGRTIPTALGVDTAANLVFASTQTAHTPDASTIGMAILDGQTGALVSAIPLATKPVAQNNPKTGSWAPTGGMDGALSSAP